MLNTYVNRGLTFNRGEGVYLYDEKNEKYLDLMSNYGVNILGHNHPQITKTLTDQLNKIVTLHCSFANDARAEASFQLVKRCGGDLTQVYWSNSGAEAVEAALKFAVVATGKKKFIAADHAYHGKTLGALSAIGTDKYKDPFKPLLWEFEFVEFGNVEALEKAITADTAAFIVEPIQGEGGISIPSSHYLSQVSELCRKHNVLLIIDEIQTGMGRTGHFLASHNADIQYDMVLLGKGLAGGVPVGATLVSDKVAQKIPRQLHTSTFGGNPMACAGTIATLELLDEKRLSHVQETGSYFMSELEKIKSSLVRDVRGAGLMIGLEVQTDKRNEILKLLQQNHILAIPAGESVVRFLPSYLITREHVNVVISVLQKVL